MIAYIPYLYDIKVLLGQLCWLFILKNVKISIFFTT